MTNYILNKNIEKNKVNHLDNLKDIEKETWNFIAAFYNIS